MTANQKYKASKSELPFKEWLQIEQEKGNLKKHSITKEEILKPFKRVKKTNNNQWINLLGLASAGLLIYGLTKN